MKKNYRDDFEMLMVRHDFLRKIKNVDEKWLKKFEETIQITTNHMYRNCKSKFDLVSYDIEDVLSMARCFTLAYMEFYSIERNEVVKKRVVEGFKKRNGYEPTQEYLNKKEVINLISFLKQKIQDSSYICIRKSVNIYCNSYKNRYFKKKEDSQKSSTQGIYYNHKELGYTKITKKEYIQLKNTEGDVVKMIFDPRGAASMGGFEDSSSENLRDFYDFFITKDLSLDIDMIKNKEEEDFQVKVYDFEKKTNEERKDILNKFVEQNKNNKRYRDELKTAKSMLNSL